jgi:2-oxoacid:acceptor oxidoreductase delta subunit (pyruvate/2-ketoisovalerate family)
MQHEKPFAITLDPATSLINKTGSWRTERPVYVRRLPPCNQACPAGENIQAWLALAEEGRYQEAWLKIMEENPFPVIMGRCCYHPCQNACNRGQVDEAVGINSVERFLGDMALRHRWRVKPGADTGKKVMVIGAGPAGLSCAYHLRRLGHAVTVFEAEAKAGGLMRYGIPKYRMPREKLTAEIARIVAMGVQIYYNHRIEDVAAQRSAGGFDAVFLATGAQRTRSLDIPRNGDTPILDAIEVLRDLELDNPTELSCRVVVHGGGNTAMDVARSAVRLGAMKVSVVARAARENLRAHPMEIREAIEEGVEVIPLRSIRAIDQEQVSMEIMSPTNERRTRPTGEFETLAADVVVEAVGQLLDEDWLRRIPGLQLEDGWLKVKADQSVNDEGIFAGGDLAPGGGTVTMAIGHGKKAARHIDAWLNGQEYQPPHKDELAKLEYMETWYYSDAPRSHRPRLDVVRRTSGFAEVVGNLDEETAAYEARRCMSCGNCFECDNCYGVCPDNAVKKLGTGKGFNFDYDYCKGCGLCASECPCGAIEMTPEII